MSAEIWNKLDEVVPGVTGVWLFEDFGKERCLAISLKQQYPGHAKQAAIAALGHQAVNRKYIVVVDDDVDCSNLREVLFAMGNRADPQKFDLIRGNRASKLDPLCADPERKRTGDLTISTLIILACKPFEWIDQFPPSITFAEDVRAKVREKWEGFLESL
jgi:4-hydroxy-3-polyprenylbenzoate decarboxylase